MDQKTTSQFVETFNPKEEKHVLWLKEMGEIMENLDPKKQVDLPKFVNQNPMNAKMKNPLDWVFIHFSLAMKYTKEVLAGRAWIPVIEK